MTDAADLGSIEPSVSQLAQVLVQLGCPSEKSEEMAAQLDRRASQLAEKTGRPKTDAMRHLLGMMRQGWAAQAAGQ